MKLLYGLRHLINFQRCKIGYEYKNISLYRNSKKYVKTLYYQN